MPAPNGHRVAIVGSGPAGLTAAWQLARKGYAVKIFESAPMAGGFLRRAIPAYRLPDKALVDEVMTMCGEIGVEIYKRQEELAAIRIDRRPDLPRIKCPTIVVCGRDDAATPLFLSEEIAKAIPAAALVVVEQCGHLVTMEKPEETNQILKLWLSR